MLLFAFLQIPRGDYTGAGHALPLVKLGLESLLNFRQQRHASLINHYKQKISQRAAGLHALNQGLRDGMLIGARHSGAAEQNPQLCRFPQEREEIAQFAAYGFRVFL